MNLIATVVLMCSMTLDQYIEKELIELECDKPTPMECFEHKKPGEENYISGDKGLDMYVQDLMYVYDKECGE